MFRTFTTRWMDICPRMFTLTQKYLSPFSKGVRVCVCVCVWGGGGGEEGGKGCYLKGKNLLTFGRNSYNGKQILSCWDCLPLKKVVNCFQVQRDLPLRCIMDWIHPIGFLPFYICDLTHYSLETPKGWQIVQTQIRPQRIWHLIRVSTSCK